MKFTKWLLGIILAIGVYSVIIFLSDFSTLVHNLQNIKLEYVLLGIVAIFSGLIVRAFRWSLMIKMLDVKINLKASTLVYLCGTAFGLSPGRLGEVAKSLYLKRLVNTPISKTAPTIIVERFLDVFAILIIALSSSLLIGIENNIIFLGYVALGIFLFLIYQKKYLIKILEKTSSIPLLRKISQKLIPSVDIIFHLLKPKIFAKTFSLSILAWLIESLVIYFVLKSFDINLSVIKSSFIYVISSLIGSSSFLPGGIGTTEGGLLALFHLENISYDNAIAPILVIRIIVLWMTIIFGIIINRLTEITILKNK